MSRLNKFNPFITRISTAITIFLLCTVPFMIFFWALASPWDFEISSRDGILTDHLMNMEVDRNITAYKEENLILYAYGEKGFWVIDLKYKNFKLLNQQLVDEDLKNIVFGNYVYRRRLYNSITYRKERYKDRLMIINAIDQLSQKEQVIYNELKSRQGAGVIVCPNHNGPIFYGPYLQPFQYLMKGYNCEL
jgi:hypothetical protein